MAKTRRGERGKTIIAHQAAGPSAFIPTLLIVGAVFAANLNALFAGFVWDDSAVIINNNLVKHLNSIPRVFTQTFLASYYRPVVTVSYALEYALWGLRPFGFHLTNVLLHTANSLLVFWILKRILHNAGCEGTARRAPTEANADCEGTARRAPTETVGDTEGQPQGVAATKTVDAAFLAALLWAAHPVHKGVVVIADRTGMLSAFFFLSAIVAFISFRGSKKNGVAWVKYGASLVLCGMAFLSKEESLTLPVVVIMFDMFFRRDNHMRGGVRDESREEQGEKRKWKAGQIRTAAPYLPFFVVAFLYLAARAHVLASVSGMAQTFAVEPVRRLLTIPKVLLNYVFLLLFPLKLDMNPRTTLATLPPGLAALLALIVLLAVVASVPWILKRSREMAFGMLWFLVVFAPMSNIIPVFPDVADRELFTPIHFLYLPSIGVFLCAGVGLRALDDRRKTKDERRKGKYGSVRAQHAAPLQTDQQLQDKTHGGQLQDGITGEQLGDSLNIGDCSTGQIEKRFFRATAAGCITCVVAVFCVLSIHRNTIWKNNIRLFEYMTRMHPENAGARVNLGNAYVGACREFDALKEFKEAVRVDPNLAQAHNALGLAYLNMGSAGEAIVELRKNTELDPSNSGAFSNLAVAYVQKGMLPEAIAAGMNAIERAPTSSETHTNMGLIYVEAGKLDEAQKELELALEFNRGDAEAYNALGALYFYRKDYAKARWHWEQALRVRPDFQEARENLEGLEKKGR